MLHTRFIKESCTLKRCLVLNIPGHSMGGLDARYLVSKMDGADFVASITTLVTPHRGGSLANWLLNWFPRPIRHACAIRPNYQVQYLLNFQFSNYLFQKFVTPKLLYDMK